MGSLLWVTCSPAVCPPWCLPIPSLASPPHSACLPAICHSPAATYLMPWLLLQLQQWLQLQPRAWNICLWPHPGSSNSSSSGFGPGLTPDRGCSQTHSSCCTVSPLLPMTALHGLLHTALPLHNHSFSNIGVGPGVTAAACPGSYSNLRQGFFFPRGCGAWTILIFDFN